MTEIVRLYDRDGDRMEAKADIGPDGRLIRGDEGVAEIAMSFLEERSVDEILTYLDGPHLMAMAIDIEDLEYNPSLREKRDYSISKAAPEREYRLSKDWIRYRGPFGGEGWQHVETGDVRYVDDAPGEVAQERQTQTTLPGTGYELPVDLEMPKWANDIGALSEIVNDTLPNSAQDEIRNIWKEGAENGQYSWEAEGYLEATGDWIKQNGDGEMASRFQEELQSYDTFSPWGETEAPEHLNPENAKEIKSIMETEAANGISAKSMMVAEMESGNRLFLTNVNEDIPGELSAEREYDAIAAKEASEFIDSMGGNVPEHHYEEGEFLAVEEVRGRSVRQSSDAAVPENRFISFAIQQILVGNTDAHSENVFYSNGDLVPIDLDLAGINFVEKESELAGALGQLYDTGVSVGAVRPYDDKDKSEFIETLKTEIDGWVQNGGLQNQIENIENEQFKEAIQTNIEAARNDNLFSEDQDMRAML